MDHSRDQTSDLTPDQTRISRLGGLPFALSIGPQGCGARQIYDYIRGRGDVCLPHDAREIFYFDRHFQRGPDFYFSHFKPLPQHIAAMEITTTAFDHPDAPHRLRELMGSDIRLICPLRHPAQRSKAVYAEYLRYGIVQGGIREAALQAPQIVYASRYADHLQKWFAVFGADKIKIMFAEDMERAPETFLKRLATEAGLAENGPAISRTAKVKNFIHSFSSKVKNLPLPILSADDLAWIEEISNQEIHKFQELTGNSFPSL